MAPKVKKSEDQKHVDRVAKWEANHYTVKTIPNFVADSTFAFESLIALKAKTCDGSSVNFVTDASGDALASAGLLRRAIKPSDVKAFERGYVSRYIKRVRTIFIQSRKRLPERRVEPKDLQIKHLTSAGNTPTLAGDSFRGFLQEGNFGQLDKKSVSEIFAKGRGLNSAFLSTLYIYLYVNRLGEAGAKVKLEKDGSVAMKDGKEVLDRKWYKADATLMKWFGNRPSLYVRGGSINAKKTLNSGNTTTFQIIDSPDLSKKKKAPALTKSGEPRAVVRPDIMREGKFPGSAIMQIRSLNIYEGGKGAPGPPASDRQARQLWDGIKPSGYTEEGPVYDQSTVNTLGTLIREYQVLHDYQKRVSPSKAR